MKCTVYALLYLSLKKVTSRSLYDSKAVRDHFFGYRAKGGSPPA